VDLVRTQKNLSGVGDVITVRDDAEGRDREKSCYNNVSEIYALKAFVLEVMPIKISYKNDLLFLR